MTEISTTNQGFLEHGEFDENIPRQIANMHDRSINRKLQYTVFAAHMAMKLFSKNSNLCDHDTSTSQTDGQLATHGITALCVASRGKNV